MKSINMVFEVSMDCPYNFDGACTNDKGPDFCRWSKSLPPVESCPLPEAANSENEEQKITTHNTHIKQALREIAAEMEKEVSLMHVPEGSEVRSYIRKWAQQLHNV